MTQSTDPSEVTLTVTPPSSSRDLRWWWFARTFPPSNLTRALGAVSLVVGTTTSPRLSGPDLMAQERLSGQVTWILQHRKHLTLSQARRLALSVMATAEAVRARFAEEEAARVLWWDDTQT